MTKLDFQEGNGVWIMAKTYNFALDRFVEKRIFLPTRKADVLAAQKKRTRKPPPPSPELFVKEASL